MAKNLKDPLLLKIKDDLEAKLPEPLKEPVARTVMAGEKLLYSPESHTKLVIPVYEAVKNANFTPQAIANGMVNFLGMLYKASRNQMPIEAAFPAGVLLLCDVLDDFEQMYQLKVTQDLVKQIGAVMHPQFVKAFGLKQRGAVPDTGMMTGQAPPGAAPAEAPAEQTGAEAAPGLIQQGAA